MANLGIKKKRGSLSELVNDPVEMAVLHDRLFPRLFRYARFRLDDTTAAEDLASDAFLNLLEAARRNTIPIENVDRWLMGTLSNLVNNHLRQRYKTPALKLNEAQISHQPGPHTLIEQSERQDSVASALMQLTDDQQQVLSLRFGGGLSLAETARIMDRQENAIKALQFRALNALRRHLNEKAYE